MYQCSAPGGQPVERYAGTAHSSQQGRSAGIAHVKGSKNYITGIENHVTFSAGDEGLTKVTLAHSGGTKAEIHLFGGCITSWTQPSKDEILYIRPDAKFDGSKPISGGIPHCFPQVHFSPFTCLATEHVIATASAAQNASFSVVQLLPCAAVWPRRNAAARVRPQCRVVGREYLSRPAA